MTRTSCALLVGLAAAFLLVPLAIANDGGSSDGFGPVIDRNYQGEGVRYMDRKWDSEPGPRIPPQPPPDAPPFAMGGHAGAGSMKAAPAGGDLGSALVAPRGGAMYTPVQRTERSLKGVIRRLG